MSRAEERAKQRIAEAIKNQNPTVDQNQHNINAVQEPANPVVTVAPKDPVALSVPGQDAIGIPSDMN